MSIIMKSFITSTRFFFNFKLSLLLLVSTIFLAACSTSGNQRSLKTSASIAEVEKDISTVVMQINATNNSLTKLTQNEQGDPKKSFKKYSSNVKKMEKDGKQLLEHTEKMRSQGKEYFDEWRIQGDTYSNQQIQSLSEQRRADLSTAFAEISNASVGIKGALKAYMTDIEEIKMYLSNDLTEAGIASISPVAAKAIGDGDYLADAIAPVSDALANAKSALAQGSAQ